MGQGRDSCFRGSDSCVQGRKQGKIEQKWVQFGRKTKGRAGEGCLSVVCPTHFPGQKLALKTKEDYFAYFMFSFWVRPLLTYIYNHYRKTRISECLNIWKRWETERWVIIMKPYGGWSFREMKNGRMNLFALGIATPWTGIFLINEKIMIMIISLWNCFNGFALNSSRHELQGERWMFWTIDLSFYVTNIVSDWSAYNKQRAL